MKVWKVAPTNALRGWYADKDIQGICDFLSDMDVGSDYVIKLVEMDDERYESLPEFQGF